MKTRIREIKYNTRTRYRIEIYRWFFTWEYHTEFSNKKIAIEYHNECEKHRLNDKIISQSVIS